MYRRLSQVTSKQEYYDYHRVFAVVQAWVGNALSSYIIEISALDWYEGPLKNWDLWTEIKCFNRNGDKCFADYLYFCLLLQANLPISKVIIISIKYWLLWSYFCWHTWKTNFNVRLFQVSRALDHLGKTRSFAAVNFGQLDREEPSMKKEGLTWFWLTLWHSFEIQLCKIIW